MHKNSQFNYDLIYNLAYKVLIKINFSININFYLLLYYFSLCLFVLSHDDYYSSMMQRYSYKKILTLRTRNNDTTNKKY